jgi:hypothetical protein
MSDELTAEETAALEAMQAEPVEAPEESAVESEAADVPFEVDAKPEAEAAEQEEGQGDKVKMVPHGAMHQEREGRKAAEAENARLTEQMTLLQQQIEKATSEIEAIKNPVEPEKTVDEQIAALPDPIEDPEGFKVALAQVIKPQADQVDQVQQQVQQQVQRQAAVNYAAQVENSFRQQTPDYDDALNFAVESRKAELRIWGVPEDQIGVSIHDELATVVNNSIANRTNHAQQIYEFAKLRGYKGPTPAPAEQEADRMDKLAATQQTQASLSSAGGQSTGGYTLAALANMSEAELAKVPQSEIDRVMAG